MKQILLLIGGITLSSCGLAQQFNLISSDNTSTLFEHKLISKPFNYTTINGEKYVNLGSTYKISTQEKGAPQLPIFSESISIPENASPTFSVEYDSYYDIKNVNLSPSKGSLKRNIDPNSISYEFSDIYSKNEFYPGKLAEGSSKFTLRNTTGVTITLYPYQYNPITKILRVYENLRIKVNYNSNYKVSKSLNNDPFISVYENFYLNSPAPDKYIAKGETGEMLVITTTALSSAIQPFVNWKNQKGILTNLVTTTTTGNTDTQIKSYIQSYYTSHPNLIYILLVGDHADVPAHSYGTSGTDILYSDTYYAQLAGGSNDYYPEVFIGRFSGNSSEITTMVNRTLEYEKTPSSGNWMTRAIGIGSTEGDGFGDDNEIDYVHQRNLGVKLKNYGYSNISELFDGSQGGNDSNGDPNGTDVRNELNNGAGLLNYTGHGDIDFCKTSNFTSSHINSASNTGKYPFVVSVACLNGSFAAGNCISESWLRAGTNSSPKGAIAACGSSILMAWSEPMQTQDELIDILTEIYSNNKKETLGGLFYNAQMSTLEQYNNANAKEVMQTWVFFGDPSTVFRNKITNNLTTSHTSNVSQSTTSITVNCPTNGALIAISQNNVLLGKAIASGGVATIIIPTLATNDYLLVTATKQNYEAKISTIQVGNGSLSLNELQLNDFNIYPNPSKENLFINSKTNISLISILDLNGKILLEDEIQDSSEEIQINISILKGGTYFIKAFTTDGIVTKKFIKE